MAVLPALPFIRSSVSQGLSGNEAYRRFVATAHEQGLTGIRRHDFTRLYSQTRAARGRMGEAMGAPRDVLPSPEMISPGRGESRHRFISWVMTYQREVGGTEITQEPWAVGSEELLTPEEAERRIGEAVANSPQSYPRRFLGAVYTGTDDFTLGV